MIWTYLKYTKAAQKEHGILFYYQPMKLEGYSFGAVTGSVHPFPLSGTISQYLLVKFDAFFILSD